MSKLKQATNHIVKTIVRVVLYLRLSDEDRNKLTKEQLSESIKNQERMLREYAENEGWQVVGIYNDEDYSGGDSTRPEFNKMIKECEAGNVDVVLCKSQSRFARDSELIEKYLHNKFHEWNVRFQTVLDRIDNTKRETKKTSQILGLTDEWYLEDTSLNIRETFKSKRKAGELTSSFACYGYLKDPENKNHLIIDPVASIVVKRIYDEYIEGAGLEKIADNLNNDNILCPYEYKMANGSKYYNPLIKDYINFECIEKAGTFKIDVNYQNNERQVLNNLITFNYLTTDMKTFNNKCDITLKRYSSDKIKIYYSEKENLDINKFNIKDFKKLKENDVLPKTTTCIATICDKLDRTHIMNYQLEVYLKENVNQDKYYYKIQKYCDNLDVDLDFEVNIRRKLKWSEQTIKTILSNEVYVGNLLQGKSSTVSYKNHTVIRFDEEDWTRADNTHDSIIEKLTWYNVQERLKEKSRSGTDGTVHPFANKVYCEKCHRIFCKCGKNNNTGYGYLCCKDKNEKWANCDNKKWLREQELHELVIDKINVVLKRFYDEDSLKEMNDNMIEKDLFKEKLDVLKKELNSIDKELESKSSYFQRLYEDRTKGILPEKEFLILMNKYKDDNTRLEERAKIVRKEINDTTTKKESLKTKKNVFSKYRHIDSLNTEIVNDFIDKVIVGHYDEETNSRDIKIIWNFTI